MEEINRVAQVLYLFTSPWQRWIALKQKPITFAPILEQAIFVGIRWIRGELEKKKVVCADAIFCPPNRALLELMDSAPELNGLLQLLHIYICMIKKHNGKCDHRTVRA